MMSMQPAAQPINPLEWTVGGAPKYEQLKSHLVGQLLQGALRPGQLLPSEQELADQMQMARNTVRQALAELERGGLIVRIRGKGTFISDYAPQRLKDEQHERSAMGLAPSSLDAYALVVPDMTTGYYPSLVQGFDRAAGEVHYRTIVSQTSDEMLRQADVMLQLLDSQVAGVAMVPTVKPTPAHHVRPLRTQGVPLVFCHRRVPGFNAPLITFSGRAVGELAGQALIEQGHRHVAFIAAQAGPLSEQYEMGLRAALNKAGHTLRREAVYVMSDPYKPDYNQKLEAVIDRLLATTPRPTGLFCSFDSLAELLLFQLARRGVAVPGEISIIGFGGAERLTPMTQHLTSVTVDEAVVGQDAVRLLDEMRRGLRSLEDNEEIVLPVVLSAGETLAQPPSGANGHG